MNITGVTWSGPAIDDPTLLAELPPELAGLLTQANGFILRDGALHFRGACSQPDWHSLRHAWSGPQSFQQLYPDVLPDDIPFAQDQFGDQFLLRDGNVLRLVAETGDVEPCSQSLKDFMEGIGDDIATFLNVGLQHQLSPGELLLAYPPFCMAETGKGASIRSITAGQLILFHADLARQIRDIPDGGQIEIKLVD